MENDERWPVADVLPLARLLGVPVVFDVFHHGLAPSFGERSVREVVRSAGETWGDGDGRQELHFSTQEPGKRPGAHAEGIDLDAFDRFVDEVGGLPVDCILEVKNKEQSVLRAQELLRSRLRPGRLRPGRRWRGDRGRLAVSNRRIHRRSRNRDV